MRSRPKPSDRVLRARKERNRRTLGWVLSTAAGLAGALLGLRITYVLQLMLVDGVDNPGPFLEFLLEWRFVVGAAVAGALCVLFATAAYWRNRAEAAPAACGFLIVGMVFAGLSVGFNSEQFSAWEVIVPSSLTAFVMVLVMTWGAETPEEETAGDPTPFTPLGPSPDRDHPDTWSLRYTSTLDQLVADHLRITFQADDLFWTRLVSLPSGLLPYFCIAFFLEDHPLRLEFAAGAAIAWVVFRWVRIPIEVRKRMASSFLNRGMRFPMEAEWLSDRHTLTYGRSECEIRFPWSLLESVEDGDFGFILVFHDVDKAIIPAHAFRSTEERADWKARIESFLPTAAEPAIDGVENAD